MFAQLLAVFCLLNLVVQVGWAVSDGPANSTIAVYLRQEASQPSHPLEYMKREFTRAMLAAGYRVEWLNSPSNTEASTLVVVDLRDSCGFPARTSPPRTNAAESSELASTAVSYGVVLPFSWLNCGNLTRTLAPALSGENGERRDFLYGRAMARVLAHELYHILANTTDHARDGVAKPCFTARDLVTEHFEFEQSTLAKLRAKPLDGATEIATQVVADIPSGR
jgi:hypothetical protein